MNIEKGNYIVKISEPEIYVDNLARNRSGHMTHAMTEFEKGKIIDFNSNCSPVRCSGHSAYGFVEYRISEDNGKTYSETKELPFSTEALSDGLFTVSVEKAVTCPDGSILAFCLRNTMLKDVCCMPWLNPMAVRSRDGGETWEKPFSVTPYPGRIYDALCIGDKIIFLQFKSADFIGTLPEHKYSVFTSDNNGVSFSQTELPINGIKRGYGSLLYDGTTLHAYAYNEDDERHMDHAVSTDLGKTWENAEPCYLDRGIRNPQTALIDGVYVLHGRAEKTGGFVFYFSDDGYKWSEAALVGDKQGLCYYSNNLLLNDNGKNHLLIQYSELCQPKSNSQRSLQVNIFHRTLEIVRS